MGREGQTDIFAPKSSFVTLFRREKKFLNFPVETEPEIPLETLGVE